MGATIAEDRDTKATVWSSPIVLKDDDHNDNILYHLVRKKQQDGIASSVAIRLADCDLHRNNASMVINRNYSRRGYGSRHFLAADDHRITFTASSQDCVFGTITLAVDRDASLASDKTFPEVLARLRSVPGTKLCELTKFAFDRSFDSLPLIAQLFHIIYIYGTERFACTDLLIEVNPRHVSFYKRMLGFESIAAPRENASVGAPSHLMHIKVAQIGAYIRRYAGQKHLSDRSLYSHFFAPYEEDGLRRRLHEFMLDRSPQRAPSQPGQLASRFAQSAA